MLHSREVLAYMNSKGTAKPMGYEENPVSYKDAKLSFPVRARLKQPLSQVAQAAATRKRGTKRCI